ncbi:hypothetical protein YC2023_066550 [Brassica napus]
MTDLGRLHHFLGISVQRDKQGLFLQQQNYAADILHRAGMTDCNPCLTPADTRSKLATDDSPPVTDPSLYQSTDKKKKEKTPQHGFRAQHRIGELGGSVKPWGFELVEILRHHEICCSS